MKIKLLSILLSCVVLSACQKPENFANYDAHTAFPTTAVKKTAYLGLAPLVQGHTITSDGGRLDDFIDAYRRQGDAPISVTITAPGFDDPAGRKMAVDTAVLLQKRGIPANQIKLFISESPIHLGPQLSFPIYVVTGRDCGYWQNPVDHDALAQNTDNFGCAMQQNIDVMAANPRDLLMPSPVTGRDANRSWMIVDNYQQGKPIAGADDIHAGVITSVGSQGQ
jgi:pilus biogenesis lipoprotein CpaD